jgi:hypothetical protein
MVQTCNVQCFAEVKLHVLVWVMTPCILAADADVSQLDIVQTCNVQCFAEVKLHVLVWVMTPCILAVDINV